MTTRIQATAANQASLRLAEKMEFRIMEGTLRWDRVFPPDRKALGVGNGRTIWAGESKRDCVGGDTFATLLGRLGRRGQGTGGYDHGEKGVNRQ